MRKHAILFLLLVVLQQMLLSQDFKKVIQVVGEMESSLKEMIRKEKADRQKDVESLRAQVQDLQSVKTRTDDIVHSAVQVKMRIDTLEEKVAKTKSDHDLSTFSAQFNSLVIELKKTIEEAKTAPKTTTAPSFSSIKIGVLAQVHAQVLQEQSTAVQDTTPDFTRHWQRQMLLRRTRILFGGEIAKNTTIFIESDATNIGKVTANGTKSSTVQMYVQDAYIQYIFAPEFGVIAGLQLVGITRNGLQSAASLMGLNYGSYQFNQSAPLDNNVGRDLGINFRGFLLNERLEYRAGVFSGRNVNQYSPLRTTLRLNYMFDDKEKGLFYSGTTLGKGKVLSIGAGLDLQGSYYGYGADAIVDLPVSDFGSVTASLSFSQLDGGGSSTDSTYFTGAIPRQTISFGEVGFYLKEYGIQPYIKYESQSFIATLLRQLGATTTTLDLKNQLRSESRLGVGINYFINGHNTTVKVLYEIISRNRLSLDPAKSENATNSEFTIQLQYYTF